MAPSFADDPDNTQWLFNVAESLEKIGDLKREIGDDEGACAAYEEMLSIDRRLVEFGNSSTEWQWNLSLSLNRIGDVTLALRDLDAATAAYAESLDIRRRLVEIDPSNTEWQAGVMLNLERISDLERVAEAATPAPDRQRLSKKYLPREGDDINAGLRETLFLDIGKLRIVKEFAIGWATARYEKTLVVARNLLDKRPGLGVGPALRKLDLSLPELMAARRIRLRRYAMKGSVLLSRLISKLKAGVQRPSSCNSEELYTAATSMLRENHSSASLPVMSPSFGFSVESHKTAAGRHVSVDGAGANPSSIKRSRKRRRRRRKQSAAGHFPAHQKRHADTAFASTEPGS